MVRNMGTENQTGRTGTGLARENFIRADNKISIGMQMY